MIADGRGNAGIVLTSPAEIRLAPPLRARRHFWTHTLPVMTPLLPEAQYGAGAPDRFHDPVDSLDVHCCTALLGAAASEQGMDAPVAVGRLAGDDLRDFGQQLIFRRGSPAPAAARS
jgi:hypothetical protein